MDIEAEKLKLVKMLLQTEDAALLQQLKDVFENYQSQANIPDYVKAGIAKSKEQATTGLLTPHEVVMKKYNHSEY